MHNENDSRISMILADEVATASLAQHLAARLKPGLIIYLKGDLGSGKTTLVRHVLISLGYQGRVKSPTYTLVETYCVAGLDLRHFDLYRLQDPEEWESAGFREELDEKNILFIEWPEKAAAYLPMADIEISLEMIGNERKATFHANSTMGMQCLTGLQ
ncbi:MAG: tRNA (adenosine(37)-N6)-threonylcarbamoyltransferase complex ATPase subunit type 1 TsaE [Gallionella sp.]